MGGPPQPSDCPVDVRPLASQQGQLGPSARPTWRDVEGSGDEPTIGGY